MKQNPDSEMARGRPVDDPTHFTGVVRQELVHEHPESGVRVLMVRFSAGGRCFWHSHPGGQVLHVIEGKGRVQSEGSPAVEIGPGDVVVSQPGEVHWHGAAPGAELAHLAVSLGKTEWGREVSAQEAGE